MHETLCIPKAVEEGIKTVSETNVNEAVSTGIDTVDAPIEVFSRVELDDRHCVQN